MEEAGAKWLHLDVMDGKFVPCVSFGMPVITSLRKVSNLFFDVHLMIEEPERYIKEFKEAGADMLTVHAEACRHLDRVLHEIHNAGMKAGIALNPGTSLSAIEEVLGLADMILIMTVNPGFGGQKFIPYTADKIRRLKKMLEDRNLTADIQVDGGIGKDTLETVMDAGANIFVMGSAVFRGDIKENVALYLKQMEEYEQK